jgi:hypothetical protein
LIEVFYHIEPSLSGDLIWVLRNQRYCVGSVLPRELDHLIGGGHFDNKVSRYGLAKQLYVAILNVPTITADVNRDAMSSRLFADNGGCDDAGLDGFPGLANSCNVIDVYV